MNMKYIYYNSLKFNQNVLIYLYCVNVFPYFDEPTFACELLIKAVKYGKIIHVLIFFGSNPFIGELYAHLELNDI
jgi:hypothetical protein